MTRRSRLVLLAVMAYGVALVLIASWPTHVDEGVRVLDTPPGSWLVDLGVAPDLSYRMIEGGANVLLFVPFGVLLMLVFARAPWWWATLAALMVSGCVELVQAVARPGRTADVADVATNVLGATLGALGVAVWRRWRKT